jgi:sugar-specific transcriptional regulator TrmB
MLEQLKDIGFTDGEIRVYKALIKFEKSTIGPISNESGITPAKTYLILDKLLKKGLISKIKENQVLCFSVNPERILTYLDEKKIDLELKRNQIEKELPKLKLLSENTEARVLQGIGGLRTFYEEHNRILLKKDKIFRVFSFESDWEKEEVKLFIKKQDLIRKELGIDVRVIANESIKKYIKKQEYKLVNIRFTKQEIPVGTVVSSNQIALMTWKNEPIIIVINSKDIGNAYTKFFDDLWKQAKP